MNDDLNPQPSMQLPFNSLAQNNELDYRMHQLVGQNLESKETMIRALEEQLNRERSVQKEMTEKFRQQLDDLEKEKEALAKIRKASQQMERK